MSKTKQPPAIQPVRLRIKDAQTILSCGRTLLWRLGADNVFTVVRPDGFGIGRRAYFLADEVRLYAETGDAEAVRAYRRQKGRLKK